MTGQDRRRDPRRNFNLPVRVQGHDPDGTAWEEMTQSEDACFGGLALPLKHAVFVGQALFLSLPLPKAFRQYSLSDATYRVYALVRDVALPPVNRVGVMFLGKHPPRGYEANPGGRYLLPSDPPPAPKERRTARRVDVFVNLRLVRANGSVQSEQTVTENLSRGGVRVAVRDVDGDGRADVVTGSGSGEASAVRVYPATSLAASFGTSSEPGGAQLLDPFGSTLPGGVWVG